SLGITVLGLLAMAAAWPGKGRKSRVIWTLASMVPLLPLGLWYQLLMTGGGGFHPEWEDLNVLSPTSWAARLGAGGPVGLGSDPALPFFESRWPPLILLNPVAWLCAAIYLFAMSYMIGNKARPPAPVVAFDTKADAQPAKAVEKPRWVWASLAVVLIL